ncbi:MAG: hypothetical protein ACP5OV_02940 [Acidimicrobiales bacterium]
MIATQGVFFAALAVCVLFNSSFSAQNDGISFYGVYGPTIALVVVGYASAAVGLWRVGEWFARHGGPAVLFLGARVVAVGLMLLLVTPYDQGAFLNWSHMTVGVVVALVQLASTLALLRRGAARRRVLLFSLQLAGGIVAAASLPDWHFPMLLEGESVYALAYALSLYAWVDIVVPLGQGQLRRRDDVDQGA